MNRVNILLAVRNRLATTASFLQCLAAQTYGDYRLVVLDDGSTDGTPAMVETMMPSAIVLRGTGDWWWAGALEVGNRWLANNGTQDDEVLLLINDDVRFEPDFLQRAIRELAAKPRTLLLARFLDPATGAVRETGVHACWSRLSFGTVVPPESIDCLSTRGLFLRWGDVRDIGGFRPMLLPHHLADYEFSARAKRRGFSLVTSDQVRLVPNEDDLEPQWIEVRTLAALRRGLFSRRARLNPVRMSAFVLLACPVRWMPLNLVRAWLPLLRGAIRLLLRGSARIV